MGVAYLESRELKDENEALRQENAVLKDQVARSTRRKPREQDTMESQQTSSPSDADGGYTEHSADMSRSTKDLTSKSARSDSKARRQEESRAKISIQVDKEISRLEKERAEEALFTLDVPTPRRTSRTSKSDGVRNTDSKNARKQSNTSKQRSKRVVVEDASGTMDATEVTKASDVNDLTLLSTIDVSAQHIHHPAVDHY